VDGHSVTSTPIILSVRMRARVSGSCRHSDLNYTTYISGANCVVVSVDYRLAPENPYPEAVEDAVEALQWVWQNGTSMLGIDTKRIAVGGTSRHVVFRQEILTNADS
jgi:acetyl esterase/lipase